MPLSNKALVVSLAGVLFTLSSAAGAPAPAAAPAHKSASVMTLDNGDAFMIGHKGQKIFKSNTKVSEATHKSVMAKGAKEIPSDTVIYKQGGKLYMSPGNASQIFQDDFDVAY
jgi:hypothetical protein